MCLSTGNPFTVVGQPPLLNILPNKECYHPHLQVHNNRRDSLSKNREHLDITLDQSPNTLMAYASVGKYTWAMTGINHTMRTWSSQAEPTYIFSEVDDVHPDDFYAVIFKKGDVAGAQVGSPAAMGMCILKSKLEVQQYTLQRSKGTGRYCLLQMVPVGRVHLKK